MSKSLDLNNTVVPWMARTTKLVGLYFADILSQHDFDLTREQWVLLKWLHDTDGQRQNDLALITGRNKASLTRLIHNMERKRLVERKVDEQDKRSNRIFLTEKGKQIYQSTLPVVFDTIHQIQAGLEATDIDRLIQLLQKIQTNISGSTEKL
ncbi:MAG: MarR family transcriptional regulator [Bacteroidota bacterium]